MTQASLSPELGGALTTPPSNDIRTAATSEAALWIIALTSSGLVVAAVLLLGLLARNAVGDASLGGFFAGIAVMMATVGVGAMGYVLVTAKRQGLLAPAKDSTSAARSVAPSGLHVVPAVPADLGRRKRLEVQTERSTRNKQARAIAAAAAASPAPQTTAQRSVAPRPAPPRSVPPRQAPSRSVPPRPLPPRPPAPRLARIAVAPAAPSRTAQRVQIRTAPVRTAAYARPLGYAAIQMPRPRVGAPRPPAFSPAVPVRMAVPPVMPRTQATLYQVKASNVRPPAPGYRR